MRVPFFRTLSFLEREEDTKLGRQLGALLLFAALGMAWLTLSRTTIYAVSDEGRLLAAGAASPIQAPIPGVIAQTDLVLGATVRAGEPLVRLENSAEQLRREEETARLAGLTTAIESVEQILQAERALALAITHAGATKVSSAATRAKVAAEVADLSKQQEAAMQRLREASLVSGLDTIKAAEDLQRARGQASINRAEMVMASADVDRSRRESEVHLLGLEKERSDLRSRLAASRAVIAGLDWEIARRTLRAPVDGAVADIVALPVGAAVGAGQVLATVVPAAKMRWVASFAPREAVGRIRPGQHARIRLDAFPWTAYGPLEATVVSVGSEARAQRVRVELELTGQNPNIPLSHGMTGTTDVQVEQLSPFRLVLRLAGQVMQGDTSSPSPPPRPQRTR